MEWPSKPSRIRELYPDHPSQIFATQPLRERFYRTELHSQVTTSTGELYVARRRSDHQATRWQPQEKVRENGRYLCKSTGRWGQRSYTVVQIERGRLTRQSQELASLDIRRLQYALDAEAKNPTRVEWHKTTGKLILCSELPARERKHLAVLGSLQANPTGSYYPRVWRITAAHEDTLREMLDTLAISLVSYV